MSALKLSFPGPVFYSQGDKDRFFGGFRTIPGYAGIAGRRHEVTLELRQPVCRETMQELIALLTRYGIELAHLRPALAALSAKDRAWFQRADAFWRCALFGP